MSSAPEEDPPQTEHELALARRDSIVSRFTDPSFVRHARAANNARQQQAPAECTWCWAGGSQTQLYRCRDRDCRAGLPGCAPCMFIIHEDKSQHWMQIWTENRYWKPVALSDLGYVYQRGHDGASCPNPAQTTASMDVQTRYGKARRHQTSPLPAMPASAPQRCADEEERQLRRKATYRKYRQAHLDARRERGRLRMAASRERETSAAREARLSRHREAQARYRERSREQIAHRARRATVKRNAAAGKETLLRPKTRQYWSDPDLMTDDEDEEEGDDCPHPGVSVQGGLCIPRSLCVQLGLRPTLLKRELCSPLRSQTRLPLFFLLRRFGVTLPLVLPPTAGPPAVPRWRGVDVRHREGPTVAPPPVNM
ncbi:hypothetical protein C8R46DRAFT_1040750 [Mycena filopes]|nr:hypothetical protein C8R46DRAFT_1040750 [Mycena filopes]